MESDHIRAWAEATTQAVSAEREKIIRHKCAVVHSFFEHAGVEPQRASTAHVRAWRIHLEKRLARKTVYDRLTHLSSFFESQGGRNPVAGARPQKPRAKGRKPGEAAGDYFEKLLAEMKRQAEAGDLTVMRDLAMLRIYLSIPIRRATLCELRRSDVQLNEEGVTVTYPARISVGFRKTAVRRVTATLTGEEVRAALVRYLAAAGRALKGRGPLWTRHDGGRAGEQALKPEAFVHNLMQHARRAGLEPIPLKQLRQLHQPGAQ